MNLKNKDMLANMDFRQLFLIDGIGAMVTAVLLSQVLARFESVFGMPSTILYALASLAVGFAVYSFTCYWLLKKNWKPYLKGIAIANMIYSLTTLGLIVYLNESVTYLGLIYFIGEIIIILFLASWEFKLSAQA